MNLRWTCRLTITAMIALCFGSMLDASAYGHSLSYVVAAASGLSAVTTAVCLGRIRPTGAYRSPI